MKFLRTFKKDKTGQHVKLNDLRYFGEMLCRIYEKNGYKESLLSVNWNCQGESASFQSKDAELIVYETNDITLYKYLKMISPKNNVKVKFKFF